MRCHSPHRTAHFLGDSAVSNLLRSTSDSTIQRGQEAYVSRPLQRKGFCTGHPGSVESRAEPHAPSLVSGHSGSGSHIPLLKVSQERWVVGGSKGEWEGNKEVGLLDGEPRRMKSRCALMIERSDLSIRVGLQIYKCWYSRHCLKVSTLIYHIWHIPAGIVYEQLGLIDAIVQLKCLDKRLLLLFRSSLPLLLLSADYVVHDRNTQAKICPRSQAKAPFLHSS